MKSKVVLSLILLLSVAGSLPEIRAQKQANHSYLNGEVTVKDLKTDSLFKQYYHEGFKDYDVKNAKKIDDALTGIDIKVVLGTWCHDSQVQVPKFFKILSETAYDEKTIEILTVDPDKKIPGRDISSLNIERVPTFIFIAEDGAEMGRIIESPEKTLENDMLDILR